MVAVVVLGGGWIILAVRLGKVSKFPALVDFMSVDMEGLNAAL